VERWSLTPGEKPVKMGARIMHHGRYVLFRLAEVAVPSALSCEHPAADRCAAAKTASHVRDEDRVRWARPFWQARCVHDRSNCSLREAAGTPYRGCR